MATITLLPATREKCDWRTCDDPAKWEIASDLWPHIDPANLCAEHTQIEIRGIQIVLETRGKMATRAGSRI